MKFSVSLYTIAILTGPIHSVFGQFSFPQFEAETQDLVNDIDNAIANFKAIKLNGDLETPTLVQDYQKVQADAQDLVNMAQGHGALSTANQKTLHDEFNEVTSRMVQLFQITGDDAGDFEIDPDQMNIQNAANAADAVVIGLYDAAARLAPNSAHDIDLMKADVEEANANMNNQDANSPLRRRQVPRVFRA